MIVWLCLFLFWMWLVPVIAAFWENNPHLFLDCPWTTEWDEVMWLIWVRGMVAIGFMVFGWWMADKLL